MTNNPTPTNTPTSPMDELEKRTKDVMESLGFTLVTISADYHEPFDSYFMGNDGLSIESAKKLVQLITSREQSIREEAERNQIKRWVEKVEKEYSWGDVDNYTFALGDCVRSEYIEKRLHPPIKSNGE